MRNEPDIRDACETAECFLPANRREFLKQSVLTVAGALMAAGCSRATAAGMPIGFASGRLVGDNTLTFAIPAADGAQIDKENEVILVRWENSIYAFDLSCPHQNTALKWDGGRSEFECPKHHSEFRPSGEYVPGSGRATRDMDRFAISREATGVRVDLDKLYRQDQNAAQWAAAVVKLA
ncbi:MAG TPA: Rieske (2Fe-2S) protein [Gemmatimonadaceae bacterium]|jgi:nitrite reductase/ring-hydroxylating ferredoxin subunit|nr:Rieske (2Fe-2S) protein [Gemmatimonadaceae bacterium]